MRWGFFRVSEHPSVKTLTLHVFRTYVWDRGEPSSSQAACKVHRFVTLLRSKRTKLCCVIRPAIRVVPRLTRIVVGVLQKTSSFDPRLVRAGFVVDRVLTLEQVPPPRRLYWFVPVSNIPAMPHAHIEWATSDGVWVLLLINLSIGDEETSPVLKLAGFFVGAIACLYIKECMFK